MRKVPYFTLGKARKLVGMKFDNLTDQQLQKRIVQLRDYWRYLHNTDVYMDRLVRGGYFRRVIDPSATGLVPVDPYLPTNIAHTLDEAHKEKERRIKDYENMGISTI